MQRAVGVKLSSRENDFCVNYVICGNGAEAARSAGYTPGSARQLASKMLTKGYIKERISQLKLIKTPTDDQVKDVILERVNALRKIVTSPVETPVNAGQVVSASAELNKMFGTYAPVKTTMTDNNGAALPVTMVFILPDGRRLLPRDMVKVIDVAP